MYVHMAGGGRCCTWIILALLLFQNMEIGTVPQLSLES